jgi:hypothetical protein
MEGCRLVSEHLGGFEDDEHRADSQFVGFEQAVDGSLNGAVRLIGPGARWPRIVFRGCSRRLMVPRRERKASKCLYARTASSPQPISFGKLNVALCDVFG